jgi:hypothetical protein
MGLHPVFLRNMDKGLTIVQLDFLEFLRKKFYPTTPERIDVW